MTGDEWIYVIGCAESRLVKIGRSVDPEQRRGTLQRSCPVQLAVLWQTPGNYQLENALHHRFFDHWSHGEWFDFGDQDPVELVNAAVSEPEFLATAKPFRLPIGSGPRGVARQVVLAPPDTIVYTIDRSRPNPYSDWD
jgi:hypothetical protein